jgi:hypothetical protein
MGRIGVVDLASAPQKPMPETVSIERTSSAIAHAAMLSPRK